MGFTPGSSGLPLKNMGFFHKQYKSIAVQGMPEWHMGHLAIASIVMLKYKMPEWHIGHLAIER